MKRWLGLGLALLGCTYTAGALRAQGTLTPAELRAREISAQKEAARQELENLERETGRAVQLHNGTFFRRVYSDDFIGTIGGGQAMNKLRFIGSIEESQTQYISFVVSDIRVRLYEDTAVVNSVWSCRLTGKSGPISRQMRVIHVYINGPRGWQAVASQETVLPG
jgi:hypothetical protein